MVTYVDIGCIHTFLLNCLADFILVIFTFSHYMKLMPLVCFVLPTVVPMYCWGESFRNAWFVATMFRYTLTLNVTWLVNSAAHLWGDRPYDKFINPAENLGVAIFALGEGIFFFFLLIRLHFIKC